QHAEQAADGEEYQRRDHEAYAEHGVVHGRELLQPGAAVPDRDELTVQGQGIRRARRFLDGGRHCVASDAVAAAASAAAKSSGGCTITSKRMPAWSRPQNSAQRPSCVPGASACRRRVVTWPGIASILPARRGTQKPWMTSRAVTIMSTGWPAGRCSVPSVTAPPWSG